jgi:hypothetical protein
MSTEPYPEVSGDESGIVPAQAVKPPEWPKKLRTLTAAELDRLTIDGSGRFYWDGKLVSYDSGDKEPGSRMSDALKNSLNILEQAANDVGPRKPRRIEGAELPGDATHSDAASAADLDLARLEEAVISPPLDTTVPAIRESDQIRLTLSRWQKVGAVVAVIGIALGAFGVAAYGFVAAYDWGCRAGVFQSHCAAPTAHPTRSDIPA